MRAIIFALIVIFLAGANTLAAAANQNSIHSKQFIAFFFELRRYNTIISEIDEELAKRSDDARMPQIANKTASAFDICNMDDLDKFKSYVIERDNNYIKEFNLDKNTDDNFHNSDSIIYTTQILDKINRLARKRAYKIGAAIAYFRLDTEGVIVEARVIDFLGEPTVIREVYGVLTPGRKLGEPPSFVNEDNLKFIVPVVFEQ